MSSGAAIEVGGGYILAVPMVSRSLMAIGPNGFHRLAYKEWGDPDNANVLVCVHGLTRNSRDFDFIARALGEDYRVVCPDVVGRGDSDWLHDAALYNYVQYCSDLTALIARTGAKQVDWLGTSMGGLIGMLLAAKKGAPIRRLILNDVGPFVPRAGLRRLGEYVGRDPRFPDAAEAESYFRKVMAPFGVLTDPQWRHVVKYGTEQDGAGSLRLRYDPVIGAPFRNGLSDVDLWAFWDTVQCPVMVLRGADSDLLLPETARDMLGRGPKTEIFQVPNVGHAPALMADDQIETVAEWLRRTKPAAAARRNGQ